MRRGHSHFYRATLVPPCPVAAQIQTGNKSVDSMYLADTVDSISDTPVIIEPNSLSKLPSQQHNNTLYQHPHPRPRTKSERPISDISNPRHSSSLYYTASPTTASSSTSRISDLPTRL